MKSKFTKNQRRAIYDDGGTILVSAAAGSGKTAVLTERVIDKISKKGRADKILMVTFTRASAKEMKHRIKMKLANLIEESPENKLYKEQQLLIEKASIDTISAFCINLIRENFVSTNLTPDFSIADEGANEIITKEVIDNVIKNKMEEKDEDFIKLISYIGVKRDYKKVINTINKTLKFLAIIPYKDEYLSSTLALYNKNGIEGTIWVKYLFNKTVNDIKLCVDIMTKSINLSEKDSNVNERYTAFLIHEKNVYENFLEILKGNNYDAIKKYIEKVTFEKFPNKNKNIDADIIRNIKNMRDMSKDIFTDIKAKYYIYERNDIERQIEDTKKNTKTLLDLCFLIDSLIEKKLEEKNLITFSKAEDIVLKMLVDNKGKRTDLAKDISNRFDYIFIDEYQDNNFVQDEIFKAISNDGNNLFIVGDIKQSIYGFRNANPTIFKEKKNTFNVYNEKDYPATIVLSDNFRSKKCVTDFINYIFTQIMTDRIGGVDYDDDHKLVSSKKFIDCKEFKDSTDITILEGGFKAEIEALNIAKKIKKMIGDNHKVNDGENIRNVKFSDFTILLRSSKNLIPIYKNILEENGVNTTIGDDINILNKKEIMTLISVLRVINNPTDNISMSAVMLSFIYRFTPEDLVKIRYNDKNQSLYHNLGCMNESRYSDFINEIKYFKKLSILYTVGDLLSKIIDITNCDRVVRLVDSTGVRVNNIHLFLEFCYSFESMGDATLAGFLKYLENMYENEIDINSSINNTGISDGVNIMTIHRSKGLEFHFVILAGIGREFNKEYNKSNINMHEDLGINFVANLEGFKREKTLPYIIGNIKTREMNMSEEMRILYVALSRAREKIIIYIFDKDIEAIKDNVNLLDSDIKIRSEIVSSMSKYSYWIILALLRNPEFSAINNIDNMVGNYIEGGLGINVECIGDDTDGETHLGVELDGVSRESDNNIDDDIINILKERTKLEYRYRSAVDLPTKLSVSQIAKSNATYLKRPMFLQEAGLNQKEIGNAIHKFMQFSNYKNANENFGKELQRMVENDFISDRESKVISKEKIRKFFCSDIGQNILNGKNIFREYKIMTYVYPYEIYDSYDKNVTEKILLQGIADCVIINEDITLIDYKTDRVNSSEDLIEKYKMQMDLYSKALENNTGKKVVKKIIYSFHLNEEIIV